MTLQLRVMMKKSLSILILNLERPRAMKKIYIALAVFATAMLVSCEREKSFDTLTPLGENEIGFVMQGVSTRSMEEAPQVMRGETIPMGMDNLGNALFLEETIEELNPTPATKGAPAYTVNVGKLYPNMGVYAESLDDATFELMDEDMYEHVGTPNDPNNEKGWRYHHNYGSNPWTDDTTPIDFYLRMPAQMSGVSNLTYSDKKISFDFIPLSTAKDQEDLLFSQTTLTKSEHDGYLPNGAPVMMYHALTGVKFRTNSDNSGTTKTIITKVKFTGLKGSGHCVFDGSSFEWTTTNAPYSYTQTFTNPTYSEDAWVDGTIGNEGGTAWDSDLNGTSWTAAAADHNLNNAKGEFTFWFIPQEITDAVKLEVTFCIKTPDTAGTTGGGEFTHQIDFGEILAAKNVEWKAGQLRTYTLDPKDVDVEIYDTMSGRSKTNLHVTNTGNVAEYVRMLVIGNWYGWETAEDFAKYESTGQPEPDILVGYKYSGPSDPQYIEDKAANPNTDVNEMVTPWFREDDDYGQYFDETFTKGKPTGDNKWLRGNTGFYYPDPIGPGDKMDPQSEALFTSYVWPSNRAFPTIYIPDPNSNVRRPAAGVHLIMEVAIQAISAVDENGDTYESCWDAWTAAIYPNGGGTIGPK